MPMLLFYVSNNRYVIENQHIIKVVPSVYLKKMPYPSSYMVGLLNWAGTSLPVVDFCQLVEQRKAHKVLHSRIILLEDPLNKGHLVGILGEKITEIVNLTPSQFVETGMHLSPFPYLDGIYNDKEGIIQKINLIEFFKFISIELSQLGKEEGRVIS